MNCDTGEIKEFDDSMLIEKPWVPIRDEDLTKVKHMSKDRRKNWMRNKPCVCGSGRKFKKCCWHKFIT